MTQSPIPRGPTRRALFAILPLAARGAGAAVGLGFGTYALWMLRWEDALELIARAGYDGAELALMPEWPTAPERLSPRDRARLRGRLSDLGLEAPALLESLRPASPESSREKNLDRVEQAIDLGAAIAPGRPPMLETVLGGKPGAWEDVRHELVDELGEWARVAASGRTVICFKPHVGSAVNDVERSLWLLDQVGSPYFRCTYDYSHLGLAGLELEATLDALLPVSPYVHLKDAERAEGSHRFLLPGDGATDYDALFGGLRRRGYRGYATVEVSAQIHRRDDFEPIATTMLCYERMASAFERAGLARP